jgi:hypothetical protein
MNLGALHWFDPGLSDVDAVHWLPYMTSGELGQDRPKLTLSLGIEPLVAKPHGDQLPVGAGEWP